MPETKFQLPELTHSPHLFKENVKSDTPFNNTGKRQDGRQWNEIRNLSIQCDIVHNVTSSAHIELGNTKVLCSIVGPKEMSRDEEFSPEGRVVCHVKFAPFSLPIRRRVQQEEKQLSLIISEALNLAVRTDTIPKLQVEVDVTVLENDGGMLMAGLLGASVAMATSGIEMRDIPTACTVSFNNEGKFLCDPVIKEDHCGYSGHMTVIYLPSLKEICGLYQVGVIKSDSTSQLKDICIEGSLRLHEKLLHYLKHE